MTGSVLTLFCLSLTVGGSISDNSFENTFSSSINEDISKESFDSPLSTITEIDYIDKPSDNFFDVIGNVADIMTFAPEKIIKSINEQINNKSVATGIYID